jgi:hypothetical protein
MKSLFKDMMIAAKIPKINLASFSTPNICITSTSILADLSTDQILGKVTTDSIYKDKLQTSFDILTEVADIIKVKDKVEGHSIVDLVSSREDDGLTIAIVSEHKKRLLQYFLQSFTNKEEILEVYNKIKQVFATLEKIIAFELYIFVYIITLYNQQFGGNRDLPVAFA